MTKLTREFSFSTGGTSGLLMPYSFMLILKTKGSAFYRPPMGINKLQSSTRAVSTRWCCSRSCRRHGCSSVSWVSLRHRCFTCGGLCEWWRGPGRWWTAGERCPCCWLTEDGLRGRRTARDATGRGRRMGRRWGLPCQTVRPSRCGWYWAGATENAVQKVAQWAKVNGRKFALVEYQDLTPASARMVPRRCSVAVLQFKTHKMPVCDSFEQKVGKWK